MREGWRHSHIAFFVCCAIAMTGFAAKRKVIYEIPYGTTESRIGYQLSGTLSESAAVPNSFAVQHGRFVVDDWVNERLAIWELEDSTVWSVRRKKGVTIKHVDLADSVLFSNAYMYQITWRDSMIALRKLVSGKGRQVRYVAEHPSGTTIVATTNDFLCLDSKPQRCINFVYTSAYAAVRKRS